MPFPVTLNPAAPAGTDSPAQGDDQIRDLKQAIADVFGLPTSPTSISAASGKVDSDGQTPHHVRLTNQTGGSLAANDVVGLDTANNSAVALVDTQTTLKPLVVARATIADTVSGLFARAGVTTVAVTGAVTRGNYLRKSATTKVAEDTGTAIGNTRAMPHGAFAVALTTAAGPGAGTVTAYLMGYTANQSWGTPVQAFLASASWLG